MNNSTASNEKSFYFDGESDIDNEKNIDFEIMEAIRNIAVESKSKLALTRLREFFYNLYVIKPKNIPNEYCDIETKKDKIKAQKSSLEPWIRYFLGTRNDEKWKRYWLFLGLKQLGEFNKETGKFDERNENTVSPFPPIEEGAISITFQLMEHTIEKSSDNEIELALSANNFKAYYEYAIKEMEKSNQKRIGSNDYKKEENMQRLTTIENKVKKGEELDLKDLKFLYEIDELIKDRELIKRKDAIISKRYKKSDYARIYNCKLQEIGDKREDLYKGNIKVYIRNLTLHYTEILTIKFPKIITGFLGLNGLEHAKFLKLPEIIGGDLYASRLISAQGVKFPNRINGSLTLNSLTSSEGLELPEIIGGDLHLNSLISAEGLELPEIIGGYLYLNSLTSPKGLKLPCGFPLEKIVCNVSVKNEIQLNPELYYRQTPITKTNNLDENINQGRNR